MAAQNSAAVTPVVEGSDNQMMHSLNITSWCTPGTVPEKINFVKIAAPTEVKKDEVIISIKAASIQVDDLALLQNTAAGGWFYHTRPPTVEKPVVGGCDYAGTVTKVGPNCTKLKVGDRVCGKYSKRRRSNVAVIIVSIVFISSFLFYCLLLNRSFSSNPNRITNCLKLFSSLLQLYNYIAPASLFYF